MSLKESAQLMEAQREENYKKWIESMEKHPRVGLLPSPELLTKGSSLGKDATDTIEDFRQTCRWLSKKEVLGTKFYKYYTGGKDLETEQFGALIRLAFSNSFAAMRHTFSPKLEEYVIWYYAGHGHPKISNNTEKSSTPKLASTPKLEEVKLNPEYNDAAKEFAKGLQNQPVKGGELCLHHVGYCGLYGLIEPWIASVKVESMNKPGEKENKHLIIILDSCYSGMIAQDLEELKKEKGPWNQNGCSISIQTACGANEPTCGGYFTPCFLTLNKDEDQRKLLKQKWEAMEGEEKKYFRDLPLPSPRVVTTRANSGQNSLTMEFSFNNGHKLTLFSDPGFFKFCSLSIFEQGELDYEEFNEKTARVLNEKTARDFVKTTSNFTILDYKLKTLQKGPFASSPMGLFLIEEPGEPKFAVCAHVHFAKGGTSRVGRINLVHHLTPPRNNLLYLEDHDGLSNKQVKKGIHKIDYAAVAKVAQPSHYNPNDWQYWEWNKEDPSTSILFPSHIADQCALKDEVINGARLVKQCHDFVEREEQGRWDDLARWNMTSKDKSYMGEFRRRERSQWMNQYKKEYDKTKNLLVT